MREMANIPKENVYSLLICIMTQATSEQGLSTMGISPQNEQIREQEVILNV